MDYKKEIERVSDRFYRELSEMRNPDSPYPGAVLGIFSVFPDSENPGYGFIKRFLG